MPLVRMAGYQGSGSILTRSVLALKDELATHGNGWDIQVEQNVTTTGETSASMFRSIDIGSRQIGYFASGYLSARVPELAALDLPFCVQDRHTALRALDGSAGRQLASALEKKTGYKVLGYWDNGFRHVSNSLRPIHNMQDCKGLRIRTLDSAVYRDALAALGFAPITSDVKDLGRLVQSGEVDAQENPLTNFANFGLWQYHPHVSMTGHFFGVLLLVCNREWFKGLHAGRQEELLNAAEHATALQRQLAAGEDEALTKQLSARGIQILARESLDIHSMRQATRFIVDRQRKYLPPQLVRAYLDQVAS